ncbi:MAG: T9SS type A sorting domain-containing protein, partial [Pedobacter sp.]
TYFKWQKSNIGGTIWTDMTGPGTSGIGTPVLVNGMYQYVTNLPTFWANASDSGTYYRVVVATTAANLSSNCAFKDGSATMVSAITCGVILNGSFTQFKAAVVDKKAYLTWSTANEENISHYTIERSRDGRTFVPLDNVTAKNLPFAYYNFTDQEELNGDHYYRLKMVQPDGLFKLSQIVLVSANNQFSVKNVQNPFRTQVLADVVMPEKGTINIVLHNDKGQQVKNYKKEGNRGYNQLLLEDLAALPNGMYFITFEYKNEFERRKLMH